MLCWSLCRRLVFDGEPFGVVQFDLLLGSKTDGNSTDLEHHRRNNRIAFRCMPYVDQSPILIGAALRRFIHEISQMATSILYNKRIKLNQ